MRLDGVIPANILPLDAGLGIDEAAYRHHLESLVSVEGVGGITCNGHAAEVSSLDRAERRRALAIAVETVAGRVPVVCGVFADSERDAIQTAKDAEAEGADALLVFPPNYMLYDEDSDSAYRYYRELAAAVDLPMVAFVYPRFTGMQYSEAQLAQICTVSNVVAVKEWSLDIMRYERNLEIVRSAPHEISLLTSFSTHLLPALAIGADGILSGHGSVIAHLQAKLFDEVATAGLGPARDTYRGIQRLTKVIYRDPMPNMYARMKEQLVMLGSPMEPHVRPPLRAVSGQERAALRQALVDANELQLVAQ